MKSVKNRVSCKSINVQIDTSMDNNVVSIMVYKQIGWSFFEVSTVGIILTIREQVCSGFFEILPTNEIIKE